MNTLSFWLECLKQGVNPRRIDATTKEELEEIRAEIAQALRKDLYGLLRSRNGQNVGTDSKIARANIRAGIVTDIQQAIGKRGNTVYTIAYTRAGTTEHVEVIVDSPSCFKRLDARDLCLRDLRNIILLIGPPPY